MSRFGWREIALVIFSLSVSLGMAEYAVRILAPQRLVQDYNVPDPYLGTVIKPNFDSVDRALLPLYSFRIRTNSLGFRMDEDINLSSDIHRVLVLGDSFAFGWGIEVEKSFVELVKRRVEQKLPRAQVVNAGMGGYSTAHVYRALAKYYQKVKPCAAIYFMNPNDPFDNLVTNINYRVASYEKKPNGTISIKDEMVYSPLKRFLFAWTPYNWLNQHSHLFILVKRGGSEKRQADPSVYERLDTFGGPFLPPNQLAEQRQLIIEVTLAHVSRLASLAREVHIPLMIMMIPALTELFDSHEGFVTLNDILADIKDGVAKQDVVFVDPLPQMQQAIAKRFSQKDLYFQDGIPFPHYNEQGNAVYASVISESIDNFVEKACIH